MGENKIALVSKSGTEVQFLDNQFAFSPLNIENYISDNFCVSYKKDRLAAYILQMIVPLLFISSFSFCFGILCLM